MMSLLSKTAAVVAILLTLAAPASSTVVTIGASRDATIFQNNVGNSNGAGPALFAGTNGQDSPRRGLLDFDIAGNVPAGATITSVQLTLFLAQVAGADATARTIDLNRMTANWGEGTTGLGSGVGGSGQGFPANAGDATWNARFFAGTLWATPGGDFAASASAAALVSETVDNPYVWLSTAALVSDVQGWLNAPATNFGWAVINADETTATDFRAFFTRDFSDVNLRPQLQISYTASTSVPEPASLALIAVGWIGLLASRGRRRQMSA